MTMTLRAKPLSAVATPTAGKHGGSFVSLREIDSSVDKENAASPTVNHHKATSSARKAIPITAASTLKQLSPVGSARPRSGYLAEWSPIMEKRSSSMCNLSSDEFRIVRHMVRPTDTLPGLALHYDAPISLICALNQLYSERMLFAHAHIDIPVGVGRADMIGCHDRDSSPTPSSAANSDLDSSPSLISRASGSRTLLEMIDVDLEQALSQFEMNSRDLFNVHYSRGEQFKEVAQAQVVDQAGQADRRVTIEFRQNSDDEDDRDGDDMTDALTRRGHSTSTVSVFSTSQPGALRSAMAFFAGRSSSNISQRNCSYTALADDSTSTPATDDAVTVTYNQAYPLRLRQRAATTVDE